MMKAKATKICFLVTVLSWLPAQLAGAATISWTNTSGGNWSDTANWKPNQVPGPSDNVLITSNGTYIVTQDVDATVASLTLGGMSGKQTLENCGLTLTLTNASSVNSNGILNLCFGTLSGQGLLTVRGRLDFTDRGTLNVPTRISGAMNWMAGTVGPAPLTIASNAVLTLGEWDDKLLYGALTNAGTIQWTGSGRLFLNNNGTNTSGSIYNLAAGLFDIQNDQILCCYTVALNNLDCGGFELFDNAGTVRKSAGTGTSDFYIPFTNTGTVDVQSGSLSFNGGYSQTGGTLNFGISSRTSFGRINIAGNVALTGSSATPNRSPIRPEHWR